jgi:hypothetical protein
MWSSLSRCSPPPAELHVQKRQVELLVLVAHQPHKRQVERPAGRVSNPQGVNRRPNETPPDSGLSD